MLSNEPLILKKKKKSTKPSLSEANLLVSVKKNSEFPNTPVHQKTLWADQIKYGFKTFTISKKNLCSESLSFEPAFIIFLCKKEIKMLECSSYCFVEYVSLPK